MDCVWDVCELCIDCVWVVYGLCMVCVSVVYELSLSCVWCTYKTNETFTELLAEMAVHTYWMIKNDRLAVYIGITGMSWRCMSDVVNSERGKELRVARQRITGANGVGDGLK